MGRCAMRHDKAVLVSLHELAGGANWTGAAGWLGGGALEEWHGVSVDSLGRVTALDLTRNGLSGRLSWRMGELARMTELRIADNADLSGRLPLSLTGLSLRTLHYSGTDLCAPGDEVFRGWLAGIPSHEGTGEECVLFPDREALEVLYETTGGPDWNESGNWLTLAPLEVWHGVRTDADGRVTSLDLQKNGLEGPIPPELGALARARLVDLGGNELSGPIPSELGGLASVEELYLDGNELTSVPPELGELGNLQELILNFNRLTTVPAELGRLSRLEYLGLWSNALTSIPPELGELGNLQRLDLDENRLTSIPAGLAGLGRLEILWAASNRLTSIPPELSALNSLRVLALEGNRLTDIAIESGGYPNLRLLDLSSNELTSFPPGLGELGSLRQLELDDNRLTDVPPGLGGLAGLEILDVASNELSGPLPAGLVELTGLTSLGVADNAGLTGALPLDLTALEGLEDLHTTGTELCAPADPAFLDWLEGVTRQRVALCDGGGGAAAYLTQSVQSREFPVPLVAGKPALLRVFVTAEQATDATMPPVRATFYRDGAVTHELDIPGKADSIPTTIDESSLSKSANAEIPGWVVQPGLEVVIEPDPEGTLDPELGVAGRIPPTGRMAVDVRAMPVFEVTLVPFIRDENPDSSIVDITAAMAADPEGHELFERTRLLLPVAELDVTAHPAVASPTNNGYEILRLTEMIRVAEGGRGHYLGLMAGPTGPAGLAASPTTSETGRVSRSSIPKPSRTNSATTATCTTRRAAERRARIGTIPTGTAASAPGATTSAPANSCRRTGRTSCPIASRRGPATTSSRTRSATEWRRRPAPSSSWPGTPVEWLPPGPSWSGAASMAKARRTSSRPSSSTPRRYCRRPAAPGRSPGGMPPAPNSSRCRSAWSSLPTRKTTTRDLPWPCR